MSLVNQPDFLPSAFASNGDANVIPANNDGTAGLASFSKGFPAITQTPLANGGLPPQRADFNGILKMITQFLVYIQNGGLFAYAATQDYGVPSFVTYNNVLYKCIKENGPGTSNGVQNPTQNEYWSLLVPEDIVSSVVAASGELKVTKKDGSSQTYKVGRVSSVVESNGTVTVTNEDGTQNTFNVVTSVNDSAGTNGNVDVVSGVIGGDLSNAESFWIKLGGTIPIVIQGGYHQVQQTVPFAIAFPKQCLSVVASLDRGDLEAAQTYNYTRSRFYLHQKYVDRFAHYIAIGY